MNTIVVQKRKVLLMNCTKCLIQFTSDPEVSKYADEDEACLTISYDHARQDELVARLNSFCEQNACMHSCTWTWTDDDDASVVIELIPITADNASLRCQNCYNVCHNFEICDWCVNADVLTKQQQEAGQLFIGALLMPDNSQKSSIVALAARVYGNAMAEKCDYCARPQYGEGVQHNYNCIYAKKCESCGVRVDLGNVKHKDGCNKGAGEDN